jgi:DNA-nicking Smr family endonuclease
MARRRGLTPEDRRLWEQVTASARPLRPASAPVFDAVPSSPAEPSAAAASPRGRRPAVLPRLPPAPVAQGALDSGLHMDRRRYEKLRRGRLEPEARLDLHGMSSERAHAALAGFILSAHAGDLRLVLVITGKGQPDEGPHQPRRHGILRHSLPHWLAAPPLNGRILQVVPAHQRHGGAGAFYVYLRRRR